MPRHEDSMKKLFFSLSALLFCITSFAQGTVMFKNRMISGNAPVQRPDGTGAGAGITAQLYLVQPNGVAVPLFPTTTFRTTTPAAAFFVDPIFGFIVEGVLPGKPACAGSRGKLRPEALKLLVREATGSYQGFQ